MSQYARKPQIDALPLPDVSSADMAARLDQLAGDKLEHDRDMRRLQQRARPGMPIEGEPRFETLFDVAVLQRAAKVMRCIAGHEQQFAEWARRMKAKGVSV